MLFTCSIGIPVRGSRNPAASTFVRTRLNLNLQTRWIRLAAAVAAVVVAAALCIKLIKPDN